MKHRTLRFIVALLGGTALTLTLVLLVGQAVPVRADPDVLYVAPGGNCNGVSPCYGNVQAAVDTAASGDEIRVAVGTYTGTNNYGGLAQVVYISKTVTIRGGYSTSDWDTPDPNANPSILDAQGQGRVLYITGDITTTIEGLHITGGDATGLGLGTGGGIHSAGGANTLVGNDIYSNTAGFGGGICVWSSSTTLINNTIHNNTAQRSGGGVYLSESAVLSGNTVRDNVSNGSWQFQGGGGGGITVWGCAPTLVGNSVVNNQAPYGDGGGVMMGDSDAMLNDNIVQGNTADRLGGGVLLYYGGSPTLSSNIILNNMAQVGGGAYWAGDSFIVINTVIANNEATNAGSGVYVSNCNARFLHSTFARNTGGDNSGIYVSGNTVTLTNNILVSQTIGINITSGSTVTVDGILWFNTPITAVWVAGAVVAIQNEHSGDPAFASDGYHITSASAAINKGQDIGITSDIDAEARPFSTAPDLGADEWATVEAIVEPSNASIITATVGGLTTTVTIPSDAVTETVTLKYTALATTNQGSPVNFAFAGKAFDLDAYDGERLLSNFAFSVPVTITLHYAASDVAGLDENTMILEYWNGSTWQDAACGDYDRNPEENWLAMPICHLSRFALFGKGYAVYLPLVLRLYVTP